MSRVANADRRGRGEDELAVRAGEPDAVGGRLRELGLFAGIGGISLGLERTGGFRATGFCEIDPYCQAVLRKHWPDVPIHGDVHDLHVSPGEYDILSGGFPCQPVSLVGRRLAQADPRWLWPEFARLVGEARPRYVLVENVRGLSSKGLTEVLADLASLGYDAEWQVVSAASLGAPHLRERIFLVAYPGGERRQQVAGGSPADEEADGRGSQEDHVAHGDGQGRGAGAVADPDGSGQPNAQGSEGPAWPDRWTVFGPDAYPAGSHVWTPEPDVGRVAHGVPSRVDRLRALGNAVVPQAAQVVGELILERERRLRA